MPTKTNMPKQKGSADLVPDSHAPHSHAPHIAGYGKKRPLLDIRIKQLYLDSENPRLSEEYQGKGDMELLGILYKEFNLDELADSMAQNGYFDEEPLVAIPQELPSGLAEADSHSEEFQNFIKAEDTKFTIVEGNRRLATAKLLLDTELRERFRIRHWPAISDEVADDLKELPTIIYVRRSEVVPYLGVRHIVGIQKWDSFAKARYVAQLVEAGHSVKEVESLIGDKQGSIRKNYVSYKLLEQAEDEFAIDTKRAKDNFSLLNLAITQGNIKRFLGLPRKLSDADQNEPIPKDNLANLKDLISFIFGDERNLPVIRDSREITKYLSDVVASPEALEYLRNTRNLIEAYDRSDGEEKMLLKYLSDANRKLETALGVAHRHRTPEVVSEVEKCEETVARLLKTVREPND